MSEPTRRAMRIDDYEEGTGILSLLPAAPDEIVVVVMREEDHAALTAERDTMRDDRDEHYAALVEMSERASRYQKARDLLAEDLDKCRWASGLTITTLDRVMDQRNRYREALEEVGRMKVNPDADDPKYVQAKQWHDMKRIARHALNREE